MNRPSTNDTSDREIVTTRVIDAPRELVWKVWTDPQHLAQWWGPTGFTTTTHAIQFRSGGQWHFTMHGPDGRDYANLVTYLEIAEPSRIVYRHGGEGEPDAGLEPVDFTTTVTFEALDGPLPRTRVTLRAVFASKQARDHVARKYGAVEGGQQTIARLAEHVGSLLAGAGGSAPFVLRRVVAAEPEVVFRLWTEREHLERWFGPKGCTLEVLALEARPGGLFHYRMTWQGSGEMWGRWLFASVEAPRHLAFTSSFADAEGRTCRAPMAPTWPLEMATTVVFERHAGIGGGTIVTVTSRALGANDEEQRTFDDGHASMTQGWSGTFEQLDAHLAQL